MSPPASTAVPTAPSVTSLGNHHRAAGTVEDEPESTAHPVPTHAKSSTAISDEHVALDSATSEALVGAPSVAMHARPSHNLRWGYVCMLASLVFFTTNSLLLKYLGSTAGVSPWTALVFRSGCGVLLLCLWFRRESFMHLRRAATEKLLVYRGLLGVLGSIAYYFTVPPLGAGKATLISNTYVVMAAAMAAGS